MTNVTFTQTEANLDSGVKKNYPEEEINIMGSNESSELKSVYLKLEEENIKNTGKLFRNNRDFRIFTKSNEPGLENIFRYVKAVYKKHTIYTPKAADLVIKKRFLVYLILGKKTIGI